MPAGHGNRKHPWDEMDVGDSFVVSYNGAYGLAEAASARLSPKKFQSKVRGKVTRIWRIA